MSCLAQNGFENPEWALLLNMGLRHALGTKLAQFRKFVGLQRLAGLILCLAPFPIQRIRCSSASRSERNAQDFPLLI